jgi:hypothetical protein
MADTQSSGSTTGVVAIVAIVLLVMMGFLFFRGFRHGGSNSGGGVRGNVEVNVPRPTGPGK